MKDTFIRWFMTINALLIRVSKGRIGSQLGTQSILILHTVGRKSGEARSTPIAYFEHEGKFLLVASNWGHAKDADWVFNLRQQPRARIEVRGKSLHVQAREAEGREYDRLWKYVTQKHAQYLTYQQMTSRRIPIVILEPAH